MLKGTLHRFWSDPTGMGLVEYVLLIALIAIGLTTVLLVLGGAIGSGFETATSTLDEVGPGGCRNPVPTEKNPNC